MPKALSTLSRAKGLLHTTALCLAFLGTAGTGPLAAETPIVKLAEVNAGNEGVRRVFFGKAVARETVDLAFQVGGQIVEFPIEEGETIPQTGVVARMDLEPFQLALEQAQANAQQASRTVARYEQLAGSSVSETNLEDARTSKTLADIALRNAERDMEHATLYAPFDAIVATRLVPNYSTVAAGTPVVRLHDMSELRIDIAVPETLFQRASQNTDVSLEAVFPTSPKSYPLQVREFNAETADIGQTYTITLGMPVPDDIVVLPGSSAQVTAILNTGDTRIEVPQPAIVIGNDNQAYVMAFSPAGADEGTVTRVAVEIAPTDSGNVQVLSGLESGQEIVVAGGSTLSDGDTVRRFTGFGE